MKGLNFVETLQASLPSLKATVSSCPEKKNVPNGCGSMPYTHL
jgi:hypothetical protein